MTIATYGLVGYPLSHSFSPQYFERKFIQLNIHACYKLFPIKDISSIVQVLNEEPGLLGLNVTIPYKEAVIPFLDEVEEAALEIGAVNCIKISNKKLVGFNTDAIGFTNSLKNILQPQHTNALILGTGGASKAIAYALKKMQIPYTFVSRRKKNNEGINYGDLDKHTIDNHRLIINTTPLGMHPYIDTEPLLPYQYITKEHLLYDLIYNPTTTRFLTHGITKGASIKNGLEMLELQAEASWNIWHAD
ncbi:MAG: shikimate dehydrogenase [Flavipsychrobacter sp.]